MKALILSLLLCSCSFFPADYSVKEMTKPETFPLTVEITIHPADVGVMAPPIAGMTYPQSSRIIVEGYLRDGQIVIRNRCALGHEVVNMLNYLYPDCFIDPETLPEPLVLRVD